MRVDQDRNQFDYLYSTADLSALGGTRFRRVLADLFGCSSMNIPMRIFIAGTAFAGALDVFSKVLRAWEKRKLERDSAYQIEHERVAIDRASQTIPRHSLLFSSIRSGNCMLAFSIDELLPDGYSLGHFWKADTRHTGVYDYLLHHKAMQPAARGVRVMNYEQDLGLENLRASKMRYRPTSFLKKYRITSF